MKKRAYMAWVTPMSRTRPARRSNAPRSSSGRPNSLTSRAPDTLKRSFMVLFISALMAYDSRVMTESLRPTRLAGITKIGRITRLMRVICHDSRNITISTRVTLIRLETTDDRVSVKACWAPMTSLLSRLMRAPVWVRVKKAIGIFWMWANTCERMS